MSASVRWHLYLSRATLSLPWQNDKIKYPFKLGSMLCSKHKVSVQRVSFTVNFDSTLVGCWHLQILLWATSWRGEEKLLTTDSDKSSPNWQLLTMNTRWSVLMDLPPKRLKTSIKPGQQVSKCICIDATKSPNVWKRIRGLFFGIDRGALSDSGNAEIAEVQ